MRCTEQERLQLGWKSWASATQRQQQETETGENRAPEPYICASWHSERIDQVSRERSHVCFPSVNLVKQFDTNVCSINISSKQLFVC